MRTLILIFLLCGSGFLLAQSLEVQIADIDQDLSQLAEQQQQLEQQLEALKLASVRRDLKAIGLPSDNFVEHSAMLLSYNEDHEQASWVAHIIRPEIIDGTVFRSNDFRPDPLVATGTAIEADYFLKSLQADSSYTYDGYGFDRGHLAPSADFRWSAKALSESYFYSNMSPQRPAFNREGWAELEGLLRAYIYDHPSTQLYVVTGPVLHDQLPKVSRSINGVSIPEQYFKVALDLRSEQAIAFLMPNSAISSPLGSYATTVDEVEALTGLDFFSALPNQSAIESSINKAHWLPEIAHGDVDPIAMPSLPPGHYNTVQAKRHVNSGKRITVVGKVVSTRYSRSGNLWLNIDKQFPNQIFSVFIKKEDLINFSYDPERQLAGKVIAVKGKIRELNGTPTLQLGKEEHIEEFIFESR